jgi:hypothetical protein
MQAFTTKNWRQQAVSGLETIKSAFYPTNGGIALLCAALQMILLQPAFQTTDDMYLQCIASGYWTGEPHEALIFSHVWLGLFLKNLYTWQPALNWYVLFQVAVPMACCYTLVQGVFPGKIRRQTLPWVLGLYATVFAEAFLWPQYTVNAYLAGACGWFLWLQSPTRARLLAGFLFLGLSALLRSYCFWSISALALPLYGWQVYHTRRYRALLWPLLAAFGILALVQIEKIHYVRQWQEGSFMDYQIALDAIANGPNQWEQAPPGERYPEFRMLDEWWLLDPEHLGRAQVIQLSEGQRSRRFGRDALAYAYKQLSDDWHVLLLFGLLFWLCGLFQPRRRWQAYILLSSLALQWFLLVDFSRLPHRVMYPQLIALLFWALAFPPAPAFLRTRFQRGLAFLVLLLALAALYKKTELTRFVQRQWAYHEAFMARHPQELILYVGGPHNWDGIWQWRNPAVHSSRNALPLGWVSNTPAGDAVLRYHQLTHPARALLEHPERFIIAEPPQAVLQDYFRKFYGVQLEFSPMEAQGIYYKVAWHWEKK